MGRGSEEDGGIEQAMPPELQEEVEGGLEKMTREEGAVTQGSFGQSSTASSSAFASAMHIERSMVRSKIQRPPLAEEDEEGASDADSFFSASDEDHDEEDCRCLRTQTFTPYFYFEVYL